MKTTVRKSPSNVTHQADADNVQITRHYVGETLGYEEPSFTAVMACIGFLSGGIVFTLGMLFFGGPQ